MAQAMRSSLAPALAGLALLLAGCRAGRPGPRLCGSPSHGYRQSFAEAASALPGKQASEKRRSSTTLWWRRNPRGRHILDALIAQALKSAPDLAEAQARVREARALQGIAGASRYPYRR